MITLITQLRYLKRKKENRRTVELRKIALISVLCLTLYIARQGVGSLRLEPWTR